MTYAVHVDGGLVTEAGVRFMACGLAGAAREHLNRETAEYREVELPFAVALAKALKEAAPDVLVTIVLW